MKYVFLGCFFALVAAGAATWITEPAMQSEVPVIYWSTDPNPARIEQIQMFHEWLVKNGHTTEDGKPFVELRLEAATDGRKKVIHGVSGVAADIMDCSVPWFTSMGLLEDVTEEAKEWGFDVNHTYAALEPLLTVDGRQYAFPCNVNVRGFWVNVDTFEKLGMEPPPREWNFDTFERLGKKFVKRANPAGQRQTVFFVDQYKNSFFLRALHRSLGVSEFNETLTYCTLDDPGYVRMLKLCYKWTYEDHLIPSAAEEASFASEAGYGGSTLSLFHRGNYGMVVIGRWILIRLREFQDPPRVSVSHFPYAEFPNAVINTRPAGIYAGSKHKNKAKLFLAFLASEDYNQQIVSDADALPPDPAFTTTADYLRPPQYPNEWGAHEVPAEGAKSLAIAISISPFVPRTTVDRLKTQFLDKAMANLVTPKDAARETAERINAEIELTLKESPKLRQKYDELAALQKKIDQYRKEGKKVPLEWIKNPFHKRYYMFKGWAEEK